MFSPAYFSLAESMVHRASSRAVTTSRIRLPNRQDPFISSIYTTSGAIWCPQMYSIFPPSRTRTSLFFHSIHTELHSRNPSIYTSRAIWCPQMYRFFPPSRTRASVFFHSIHDENVNMTIKLTYMFIN